MSGESEIDECLKAFEIRDKKRCLDMLVQLSSPAKVRGKLNQTLLHLSARNGWYDVSELLTTKYLCDPFSEDDNGYSVLHYACTSGNLDLVKYFIREWRLDPLVKKSANSGETPLDISSREGHSTIVEYLKGVIAIRPTVPELCFELEELVDWEKTVIHLPEMIIVEVLMVKRNESKVHQQKEKAFGTWLRRCPGASWSHVRDALHKAGEYALETKIAINHHLSLVFLDLKSQATGDMKDSNEQQKMSLAQNNNEESTLKSTDSSISHIEAFKKAVARKGSLTCYITQCMPFGLPRVGKTCLYHCLLDRKPPGKPTTREELGSGPESTNILTKRRMIQIKIHPQSKRLDKAIVAEGCQWNEISTLQDEIALYLKAVHSQQKLHQTFSASPLPGYASKCINLDLAEQSTMPSSVMHFNTKEDDLSNDSSSHSTVQLDDAILNAITDHVKHGEVDLAKVHHLLDTSLTIFYTDTGGQPEFHEVLPALAAGPMIFMLAFNLFEPLEKVYEVRYACSQNDYESYGSTFTVKEVLMQCLSSIVSYHQAQSHHFSHVQHHATSKYSKFTLPPTKILVVGTHSDLVSEEDVAKIDEAFQVAVADTILEDEGMIEYYNEEMLVIPINNYDPLDGGKVRDVFDRAVKKEISGVSPYKVELPVHWLGMELYLRQQESSVVSYKNCLEIGMKLGMQEEELSSCLWYLHHRMGTIRHYGGLECLQDIVITEPSVLFHAVTEFITSTFTLKNVEKSVKRSFQSLGLFRTSEVEHIFNRHKDRLQIPFHKFIVLLQYLNILGPAHDEDYDYFLPCALAHAPPLKVSKQKEQEYDPLLASFSGGFVPKGLFSGVLAKCCIGGWKIKHDRTIRRKPLLFRNQATFVVDGHSVTMAAKAKHLEFLIEWSSTDDVSNVFCRMRDILKKAIEGVLEGLGYTSNFKFGFYCTIPECEDCEVHFAAVTSESCAEATCSITQEVFSLDQKKSIWFLPSHSKPDALAIKIQQITNCTNEPGFHGAQGIIFIVGIYGADGTAKDVENVEATFKQLNFASFIERDPTSAQIAFLINAAAACKYPDGYKYIAFYFAGHGGREESTGKLFINGLQLNEAKPEILHIEEFIVDPLQRLKELKKLLFFDCQTPGSGTAYHGGSTLVKNPKPLPNVLLAFSASEGKKSFGDKTKGGMWTYYLCKNLKKKKSVKALLIETSKDAHKLRKEFQEPQTFCLPEFDEVILQQDLDTINEELPLSTVVLHSSQGHEKNSIKSIILDHPPLNENSFYVVHDIANDAGELFKPITDEIIAKLSEKIDKNGEKGVDVTRPTPRMTRFVDSRGQPHFLNALPLLYTNPSLFIIAIPFTEGLDKKPQGNHVLPDHLVPTYREMIIQVCDFAQRAARSSSGKYVPKVFVLVTDENVWSYKIQELNDQFKITYNSYRDVLICKSEGNFFFAVNTTATSEEQRQCTKEIQCLISTATKATAHSISLRQVKFHLELSKGNGVAEMSDCYTVGKGLGMNMNEINLALHKFSKAGLILCYPADNPKLVITKLDSLSCMLSRLIEASFNPPSNDLAMETAKLKKKGVFSRSFLTRALSNLEKRVIADNKFLELLLDKKIVLHIKGDKYFLPSALTLKPSSDSIRGPTPLALLWDNKILPHGFFPTVAMELLDSSWGEDKYFFELPDNLSQCRGEIQLSEANFKIPGLIKLTDRKSWIQVSYSSDSDFCSLVYSTISEAVQRAVTKYQHTGIKSPKLGFICPLCPESDHYCSLSADSHIITCSLDKKKTSSVTYEMWSWIQGENNSGLNVIAGKTFPIQMGQEMQYSWEEYGIDLHLSEIYLLQKENDLEVRAIIGGQFVFPPRCQLVSGLYLLSLPVEVQKKLEIKVEHCVNIKKLSKNKADLCFIVSVPKYPWKQYEFTLAKGGDFTSNPRYGMLELSFLEKLEDFKNLEKVLVGIVLQDNGTCKSSSKVQCSKERTEKSGESNQPVNSGNGNSMEDAKNDGDNGSSLKLEPEQNSVDPVEYLAFTNFLYKYGKQCEVEFCAVKNLKFHQEVVRNNTFNVKNRFSFCFKAEEDVQRISLFFKEIETKVPEDESWKIVSLNWPCAIKRKDIDRFCAGENACCDPPKLSLIIKPVKEEFEDLTYPVPVHGITEEDQKVTIFITEDDLKSGQQSSRKSVIQQSTADLDVDVTPDELDVDSILVPPELSDVYSLTKSQSAKWEDIGRSLNVPLNIRKSLRKSGSSDDDKLEEVLDNWIESQKKPVTWSYFIEALESIEMKNVAKKVKDFLKTPKAIKIYGKS